MAQALKRAKHMIRRAIMARDYLPGVVLPPLAELAKAHSTSSATMERGLAELADEGVVKRIRRKGTIVQELNAAPLGRVCVLQSTDMHTNQLLVEPIHETLIAAGYGVDLVQPSEDLSASIDQCEHILRQRESNGILLSLWLPHSQQNPIQAQFELLLSRFEHTLVFQDHPEPVRFPSTHWVTIDLQQMGRDVMVHLLELGHRRIAVDAGSSVNEYSFVRDLAEFCRHLVEVQGGIVVPVLLGVDRYLRIAEMVRRGEISALWAITDHDALMVMNALHREGLSVPHDVSIVGRNNTPWGRDSSPSMTTTSWEPMAIARALTERTNGLLAGENQPRVTRIKPSLVVRESSAPAKTLDDHTD